MMVFSARVTLSENKGKSSISCVFNASYVLRERGREEEWKESVCERERQSKCSATSY